MFDGFWVDFGAKIFFQLFWSQKNFRSKIGNYQIYRFFTIQDQERAKGSRLVFPKALATATQLETDDFSSHNIQLMKNFQDFTPKNVLVDEDMSLKVEKFWRKGGAF